YITIPKRSTDVKLNIVNECPFIEVDDILIRSLLNSGYVQIGSVDYGFSNSRIMQIRQYITNDPSLE
ncbi:spore gernimation protein GerPE, partial [Bacillus cereus]